MNFKRFVVFSISFTCATLAVCCESVAEYVQFLPDNAPITCHPGQYRNGNVCTSCPVGYECPDGTQKIRCDNTHYSDVEGASECSVCGEGEYSNYARTDCSCNGVGEYFDDDNNDCKACPGGFDSNLYDQIITDSTATNISRCGLRLNNTTKCGTGTSVTWHYDVDDGWVLDADANVEIVRGGAFYKKNPLPTTPTEDMCDVCMDGKLNLSGNVGEDACESCSGGNCVYNNRCYTCKAGYYCPGDENNRALSCLSIAQVDGTWYGYGLICPIKTYSAAGRSACTQCASDYTTDSEGTAYDGHEAVCKQVPITLNNATFPNNVFIRGRINADVVR